VVSAKPLYTHPQRLYTRPRAELSRKRGMAMNRHAHSAPCWTRTCALPGLTCEGSHACCVQNLRLAFSCGQKCAADAAGPISAPEQQTVPLAVKCAAQRGKKQKKKRQKA
jgi:hypothetical protein